MEGKRNVGSGLRNKFLVMRAYVLSYFRTYDNGTYRTDGT